MNVPGHLGSTHCDGIVVVSVHEMDYCCKVLDRNDSFLCTTVDIEHITVFLMTSQVTPTWLRPCIERLAITH